MPSIDLVRSVPIIRSPRVIQLESIFDVPLSERSEEHWKIEFDLPETWSVGLIVGPSGCGKTSIAREIFKDKLCSDWTWSKDNSIVDCFPRAMSIKEIVGLLSSVGFSSPPSWLRPFHVLSNGEKFRASIARTLAEFNDLAVVDEFTSVVDRTVAKITSAAVAKTVRTRGQKFVAVSCHYDIAEWLEPDWIYDPSVNKFARGNLHRPEIRLSIYRAHHSSWEIFRKHHYLDTNLHKAAVCFVADWNKTLVAFSSWLPLMSGTVSNGYREHRTVTLPDFQGVGIGNALSSYCASLWKGLGKRPFSTTSHPSMIASRVRSKLWRVARRPGLCAKDAGGRVKKHSTHRMTTGFEYMGNGMKRETALRLLEAIKL